MKIFKIKLDSVDDVRNFVSAVTLLDGDFDIVSGRYMVDAKSIMGILSLDFSQPLELRISACTEETEAKLQKFIID